MKTSLLLPKERYSLTNENTAWGVDFLHLCLLQYCPILKQYMEVASSLSGRIYHPRRAQQNLLIVGKSFFVSFSN